MMHRLQMNVRPILYGGDFVCRLSTALSTPRTFAVAVEGQDMAAASRRRVPVLIVGGGPVGLIFTNVEPRMKLAGEMSVPGTLSLLRSLDDLEAQ